MKIKSAEYVLTAVKPEQYPVHNLPEIAMAGRSNVGKSSLINRMVNRKKLARISNTPGKTRTVNFYLVNESFYLVDLPGYGFARVSKNMKQDWAHMVESYLCTRQNLRSTILLVDIRHKPSAEDQQMYDWLQTFQQKVIVACTKADKISRGRWPHHLKIVRNTLGVRDSDVVLPSSALSWEGVRPLLEELEKILGPEMQK